ncbi:hypothetical protein BVY01_02755 [bacterium I07]|nr:hypothetical protein BVY01_02755 [bacterium I07]
MLNPAAPLCYCARGISFLFSENEDRINAAAASHSALPGGYRNNNGSFNNIGNNANFWSSTENNNNNAWNRKLNYNNSEVNRNNNNKQNGFSVRCVRDLITVGRSMAVSNQRPPCNINATIIYYRAGSEPIID